MRIALLLGLLLPALASARGADGLPAADVAATPPRPEDTEKCALGIYPSPLLPPVRDPYVFLWCYGLPPDYWRRLQVANVNQSGDVEWGASHGVLPLQWIYGPQGEYWKSQQAWLDYYGSAAKGYLGFGVDEWQSREAFPQNVDWALEGLRQAEAQHPESYSVVYWRGEDSLLELAPARIPDLIVIEGYTNVVSRFPLEWGIGMDGIKARIEKARKAGMIEQTIVMLGHIAKQQDYHPGHVLTAEMIDEQIRELRAFAPQMPGVGFYFSGGEELGVVCDALAKKHFVDPAPEVTITEPTMETRLATPHVMIRADAKGKDGRRIRQYRWFVDNRFVSESSEPKLLWDLRGETAGYHFLTVHAIDDAWNRSAAQIGVRVER